MSDCDSRTVEVDLRVRLTAELSGDNLSMTVDEDSVEVDMLGSRCSECGDEDGPPGDAELVGRVTLVFGAPKPGPKPKRKRRRA